MSKTKAPKQFICTNCSWSGNDRPTECGFFSPPPPPLCPSCGERKIIINPLSQEYQKMKNIKQYQQNLNRKEYILWWENLGQDKQ